MTTDSHSRIPDEVYVQAELESQVMHRMALVNRQVIDNLVMSSRPGRTGCGQGQATYTFRTYRL